jgi:hypothetical protein
MRRIHDTSDTVVGLESQAESVFSFADRKRWFVEVWRVAVTESLCPNTVVEFLEGHVDSPRSISLSNCRSARTQSRIFHRVSQEPLAVSKNRLETTMLPESETEVRVKRMRTGSGETRIVYTVLAIEPFAELDESIDGPESSIYVS